MQSTWKSTDEDSIIVVELKENGDIKINESKISRPEVTLLTILGWYLILHSSGRIGFLGPGSGLIRLGLCDPEI
jgi:hypothetical protein